MARIKREYGSLEEKKFASFTASTLASSIITMIMGFLIFFLSEQIGKFIGYLVGLIFIYTGILNIYKFIKREGAKLYSLNILYGILMIILGIVIMVVPTSFISYLNILFGIFLIIIGGNKVTYGIWFKLGSDSSWLITVFSGLMVILFGVLLIINPFKSFMTVTKVVGLFLILYSIIDITTGILYQKRKKEITKIFW